MKKAFEENIDGNGKNLWMSKLADLDNTVFEWYKRIRTSKSERGINGPLSRKAIYFALLHGFNQWELSINWIYYLKNR